jgi:hypothetical protein
MNIMRSLAAHTNKGSMKSIFKRLYGSAKLTYFRSTWLLRQPRASENTRVVHFLVIKEPYYATLVQSAVESYLFNNAGCKVVIHCDGNTIQILKRKLLFSRVRHPDSIFFSLVLYNLDWRIEKFRLLLSLHSSNDLFLDADTLTHCKIGNFQKPVFFAHEGNVKFSSLGLSPNIIFENLFESFNSNNTTAFGWGGVSLAPGEVEVAWEIFRALDVAFAGTDRSRIVEQLAISIFVDWLKLDTDFVKSSGAQFNREVISTSYYGATSAKFF